MTEQDILNLLSLNEWERFLFNYQNIAYYGLLILTIVRLYLNMSIYSDLEHGLYVETKSDFQELKDLFKEDRRNEDEKYYYPKKPFKHGAHNWQEKEFYLICIFTVHWGNHFADTPKIKSRKRVANILNVIWIFWVIGAIFLVFRMRDINHFMGSARHDLLYFTKPYKELIE